MKFKLKAGERHFEAYGHEFKPNAEIEVIDENLIKKFKKYHQIESLCDSVENVTKAEAKEEKTKKDLLQEECEAKSIKYDKRWGEDKLQDALNGD